MNSYPFSAFVVAGTSSNCGKTTLTLGLMAAFKARGMQVQPFKCGPDFIDPTLHSSICGRPSRNLDLRMCDSSFVQETFAKHSTKSDIAIIEGVMGMYDGGEASSASLAHHLCLPVILVVDVRSQAESVAAVVKGFESLQPDIMAGVIFNRVASERHKQLIAGSVSRYCHSEILGFFPRDLDFELPSRHLGLHMAEDQVLAADKIARLVSCIEEHIDLDRLQKLCATNVPAPAQPSRQKTKPHIRLAVARDKAFCFYYEDNFAILQEAGAELVWFSPLADQELPPDIDAIYLGGGYPELYARELSENSCMRQAIKKWSLDARPLYAECGGFMYLCAGIQTNDTFLAMCDVFPVAASMKKRLSRLGYRQAVLQKDSLWGPAGTVMRGHEFHYSDISTMPDSVERIYRINDDIKEGYQLRNTLGSYLHLHFGSSREAVSSFINFCKK